MRSLRQAHLTLHRPEVPAPERAAYTLNAAMDYVAKTVTVDETVTYPNHSGLPLTDMVWLDRSGHRGDALGGGGRYDGLLALLDERVEVVDGDFSQPEPLVLPSDLDVVMHCAATVSFDPPIDEGFRTNLLGAVKLYESVLATNAAPHLLHVSTAYVAGNRKGVIPEATLDHRVDWRTEAELALQARHDVEAASRRPEMLDRFMEKARKEHGRAGPQTVADDAEEQWGNGKLALVTDDLVELKRFLPEDGSPYHASDVVEKLLNGYNPAGK